MRLNVHECQFSEVWDLQPATWVLGGSPMDTVFDGKLTILEVEGGQRKDDYSHTGRSITWDVIGEEPHMSGQQMLILGRKQRFIGNDEVQP